MGSTGGSRDVSGEIVESGGKRQALIPYIVVVFWMLVFANRERGHPERHIAIRI